MSAAVATLVEGDHVVAGRGEEGDRVAPAIGDFRKAVDEEDERPGLVSRMPCFEDMETEAVRGGVDETRGYA